MKEIEAKWYDVELTRQLARQYYHLACQSPCRLTRGKAGWELLKINQIKAKHQRQFVQLCDSAMSTKQLYQRLQSENLQIQFK